ncbi:hypothetical protein AB0L17_38555, partial [Streptomyces cellulosae]
MSALTFSMRPSGPPATIDRNRGDAHGGGAAAFEVTPKAFSDFVEAAARGSLWRIQRHKNREAPGRELRPGA